MISVLFSLAFSFCQCSIDFDKKVADFYGNSSKHTNNWAVLVDTSRFWFNYRHAANALAVYRAVKKLGIPDSNIILMLSDDMACNPRNVFPGQIFHNENRKVNVYGESVEVDYRGYEVTVESFIRVLTGRHEENVPRNKRLLSDDSSNVLIYMTGHGGDEFLKFQDAEEINSQDIADAFEQMYQKKRYNELFFIVDTCQAQTLYKRFYSPNVVAVGSSARGENSYSHHADSVVGVAVVDRMTYYLLEFLEQVAARPDRRGTLADLARAFDPSLLGSSSGWRTDLFRRPLDQVPLTDFFAAVVRVAPTPPSSMRVTVGDQGVGVGVGIDDDADVLREREQRRQPTRYDDARRTTSTVFVEKPWSISIEAAGALLAIAATFGLATVFGA